MFLMKKIFIYCTLFIIICSCSDEEHLGMQPSPMMPTNKTRNLDEAVSIARNALNLLEKGSTRATNTDIDMNNIKYIVSPATRSTGTDTLLYIVDYAGDNGFAIVSANKNTDGLLAVTAHGNYDPADENCKQNGGFTTFMEMAKDYVSTRSQLPPSQGGGNMDKPMELKFVRDTVNVIQDGPKLTVQWGQTGYEGAYCPNGIAGCANVAMAQIMSYFCYPYRINVDYKGAQVTSQVLNWNVMKLHRIDHAHNSSCPATEDAHIAIGQLHRQLGKMNKSTYYSNSTSTYASDVKNSFENLGYTVSPLKDYDYENFDFQIGSGELMYMRGSRKVVDIATGKETFSGHAWVVDGTLRLVINESEWTRTMGELAWKLLIDYGTYTSDYFHINWGWNGNCNGYFSAHVLATDRGFMYDNGIGFNNGNKKDYKYNVQYFEVSR